MKIGIYGGTFDPPHLGHMEAARTALEQMNLDRLIIIPDCEPPHKDLAEEAATPQQRLEMAALMADGLGPRAEVSDLEIRREGKSYTADTVEAARAAAVALARYTEGAVVISGESDLVTDGHSVVISHGGSALMGKVTGFGCSQGGVLAVYATQTDPFTAAVAAVNHYNLAGVAAAAAADAPASFKVAFIDELFRATPEAVAGNSIEIQEA